MSLNLGGGGGGGGGESLLQIRKEDNHYCGMAALQIHSKLKTRQWNLLLEMPQEIMLLGFELVPECHCTDLEQGSPLF